jgi:hypothetical protein
MTILTRILGVMLIGLLAVACSSTTMSGSWSDTNYKGQIKNVFIIGIAKKDLIQRMFEDTFGNQLSSQGVKTVSSYKSISSTGKVDRETIIQAMTANGCDSVLLTKLIGRRTETVSSPGYASGYSSGYGYGGRGNYGSRNYGHGGWGNYHNRSYDVVYSPPTTTEFVILTVESVLYDLKTEEMIWSAQLETVLGGNIEKMMQDFTKNVTKDLKQKGLI